MVWGRSPILFLCMWLSSFPSTVCWEDCLFPIEWSWRSCQKSFDGVHKSSFLVSLLCSFVHVCYTRSILLWLLQLCSKVWNKEISMNLATLYYFSGLFWLFRIPWNSTWILGWIFYLCKRCQDFNGAAFVFVWFLCMGSPSVVTFWNLKSSIEFLIKASCRAIYTLSKSWSSSDLHYV